jgi:NAD(P)-dependent dehydrogenase (short-subunit alcohol dehydrogenase family)
MESSLSGKVALVTGGTSGIGRAVALALASEGARVVVAGRREREGNETVRLIRDSGGSAIFVKADVSREADVEALIEHTLATYDQLDVAFNNAGVEGALTPIAEETIENYEHVFDINVKGVLLSMKHEIPAMRRSGGGAIVNTASVAGHVGFANFGVYVASKHAVLGLTRAAALELAPHGIRVNAVSPGPVQTEMLDRAFGPGESEVKQTIAASYPLGRIGTADEMTGAVVYLCSPHASFVTGQDLVLDGGYIAQ